MGMTQAVISLDEEFGDEKPHIYRILVVDDDKACAQISMWTLEILGHTVKMALDGPSAIELAKSFHPDIVLCEIGMPEMNGYEVCKAMHREPDLFYSSSLSLFSHSLL
jgi:CheY-like chemotaxis protein